VARYLRIAYITSKFKESSPAGIGVKYLAIVDRAALVSFLHPFTFMHRIELSRLIRASIAASLRYVSVISSSIACYFF